MNRFLLPVDARVKIAYNINNIKKPSGFCKAAAAGRGLIFCHEGPRSERLPTHP